MLMQGEPLVIRIGERLEKAAGRVLAPADAFMNRLYGWRYNPLYHSGALVVVLLAVVLLTGVYLLLFYRIGAPYASVARLSDQVWAGRWIRSLHRYASDAAVVAVVIHAFRLFAERRSWGPRALAWITGLVLLFVLLASGWTGYVMVWDVQGIVLAQEGARWLDALPLFSEPIARTFVGDRDVPGAFFFLNLFLHVALPIGMGILLWVHVSRAARPALLPPRWLSWGVIGLLFSLSVLWPASMPPAADLFRLPERAPFDVFYAFWLPLTTRLPAGTVWGLGLAASAALLLIPWWAGPRSESRPQPSVSDERLCDACEQCYLDCPYEAIAMVEREDSRAGTVARVNPQLCVSCGICAGSCAPMGIGPPGRTGRDQLAQVREFIGQRDLSAEDIVIVACSHGGGGVTAGPSFDGAYTYGLDCTGSMHTSVVEFLVRSGVGGVLIMACPPRDCWYREGPKWLEERLYHDREAELKPRVDRRRVRLRFAGPRDAWVVREELAAYRRDLATMESAEREARINVDPTCNRASEESVAP